MSPSVIRFLIFLTAIACFVPVARAGDDAGTRYGPFGLLDHRSRYGQYWFPEPLRAPEMDVDDELRFDWLHVENGGNVGDEVVAEMEKSIGLLTLELEVPYVRDVTRELDPETGVSSRSRAEGIGAVELSARAPVFQWVSQDENLDYTLAPALEIAIPTNTDVSKSGEVVPKLFNLLRVREHFSVQASVGLSTIVGPEESGDQTLEYAGVFGWSFEPDELPLPNFIHRVVPIVEVIGERGLNHGNDQNVLTGTAGLRVNLEPVGDVQPRLGLGYVFPIDQGGRDEIDWGIITSLVFEF
jgi:hypothetical protein